MTLGFETTRRKLLAAGGLALAGLTGTSTGESNSERPQGAAVLQDSAANRPAPDSGFFDDKLRYNYLYVDDSGKLSTISQNDQDWQALNYTNQQNVFSSDDLPDPENGVHPLEDNTAYVFNGFVTSPYGLELGTSTPLLGRHGSLDGFICTGGGPAIQATNAGFFARNLYMHAPGGTLLDISGDQETEFLVESCAFSDAAGIAPMANLGTIDGYRVPAFKGSNFEDFADGLTFTGSPLKAFFSTCPFRNVTASGATIIEADANFSTEILKLSTDCYIKNVQSDTEVVRVDPSATISNYFKYFNVDHDTSVAKSNVLNGGVGVEMVGTIVRNSFPLPDSGITGDLSLDAQATVAGSGAGAVRIDDGTFSQNLAERVSNPAAGVLQYDAKYDHDVEVDARVSVVGSNTEFSVWIARNGSVLPRSRVDGATSAASKPTTVDTEATVQNATSDTPDQFSVWLENTGGSMDLDATTLSLKLGED